MQEQLLSDVNPFELFGDINNKDIAVLITYLTGVMRNDTFIRLFGVFKNEVLLFLSIFSGEAIKIPRIQYLIKSKNYCKIYSFVKTRGYTEEVIKDASLLFKVRVDHVKAVYAKVEREMAKIINGEIKYPDNKKINDVIQEAKDGRTQRDKQ